MVADGADVVNSIVLPERGYRRSAADSTGLRSGARFEWEVFGRSTSASLHRRGGQLAVAAAFAECVASVWHTRGSMRTAFNASLAFLRSLNSLGIEVDSLKDFGPSTGGRGGLTGSGQSLAGRSICRSRCAGA